MTVYCSQCGEVIEEDFYFIVGINPEDPNDRLYACAVCGRKDISAA